MTVGDSLDPGTQIGPMATARQRDRVEGYIAKGRAEGGRITTGGGRPAGRDRGWFVEPTVFADVGNDATVSREEIFGPVLTVIPTATTTKQCGWPTTPTTAWGGTISSTDPDRALRLARRVHTGTIGINRYMPDPAAPFGGVKASGIGRELGPEGMSGYNCSSPSTAEPHPAGTPRSRRGPWLISRLVRQHGRDRRTRHQPPWTGKPSAISAVRISPARRGPIPRTSASSPERTRTTTSPHDPDRPKLTAQRTQRQTRQ
ncbi:aldehyde dehydrogenase family protein, partial [Actinomadura sp. KC216]|uniref:aldehyde dehydrogenase family protein n=1 Tax=Actinomadura sp. KC216 TaxID=2530370 RepID=UPI001042D121